MLLTLAVKSEALPSGIIQKKRGFRGQRNQRNRIGAKEKTPSQGPRACSGPLSIFSRPDSLELYRIVKVNFGEDPFRNCLINRWRTLERPRSVARMAPKRCSSAPSALAWESAAKLLWNYQTVSPRTRMHKALDWCSGGGQLRTYYPQHPSFRIRQDHGRYRSLQLQASIARALGDTDDLDRIFLAPPDDAHKTVLTERNPA
jgi:hypothetical protein